MRNTESLALFAAAVVASAAFSSSSLSAQVTVSSPKGYLTYEGSTTFYLRTDNRRYQNIDATHIGNAFVIRSLAMRRDGRAIGGGNGEFLDVSLKMGMGGMAHVSGVLDKNFSTQPTTVFQKNNFKFPDWSTRPSTAPAPFNLVMPFGTNFVYSGQQALIWDVTFRRGNSVYMLDRAFYTSSAGHAARTELMGSACGSYRMKVFLGNTGVGAKRTGLQFDLSATGAPANALSLLSMDLRRTQITVPGWCGRVYVAPTVLLPVGSTTAKGELVRQVFSAPFSQAVHGATLYSQLASVGSGGIRLSTAFKTTMPAMYAWDGHDSAYLYHDLKDTHANAIVFGGSFVARLSSN